MLGLGIWWLQEWFRCHIFTRQRGAGCINGIKAALKTDLPAGSENFSWNSLGLCILSSARVCVGWWRRNETILGEQSNICMLIEQVNTLISCVSNSNSVCASDLMTGAFSLNRNLCQTLMVVSKYISRMTSFLKCNFSKSVSFQETTLFQLCTWQFKGDNETSCEMRKLNSTEH